MRKYKRKTATLGWLFLLGKSVLFAASTAPVLPIKFNLLIFAAVKA
jgi:hypothetical protein